MTDTHLDKLFETLRGITRQPELVENSQKEINGETYLFVGLGNPGRDYKDTRHNIGFMLLDVLASRLNVDFTRTQSKALITSGHYQDRKIILAKPQTYMNKSGHAVSALIKFYKLKYDHFILVYDDVDLPFASIRMKSSGGSAGHKGMESIIEQLGWSDFPRLRLGVGRPPGHKKAANYVLKPFSKDETEFLNNFLDRAADAAQTFVTHGIDYAMTHFNRNDE